LWSPADSASGTGKKQGVYEPRVCVWENEKRGPLPWKDRNRRLSKGKGESTPPLSHRSPREIKKRNRPRGGPLSTVSDRTSVLRPTRLREKQAKKKSTTFFLADPRGAKDELKPAPGQAKTARKKDRAAINFGIFNIGGGKSKRN